MSPARKMPRVRKNAAHKKKCRAQDEAVREIAAAKNVKRAKFVKCE
jgi:hypothetical protein